MSESVKIQVGYEPGPSGNMIASVVITTDLARQIVALARDASEEQQFPPEARITPAKLILNPSGTMHMAQSTPIDAGGEDAAVPCVCYSDDAKRCVELENENVALRSRVAELEKERDEWKKGAEHTATRNGMLAAERDAFEDKWNTARNYHTKAQAKCAELELLVGNAKVIEAQRDDLLQQQSEWIASGIHHDSLLAELKAAKAERDNQCAYSNKVAGERDRLEAQVAELEKDAEVYQNELDAAFDGFEEAWDDGTPKVIERLLKFYRTSEEAYCAAIKERDRALARVAELEKHNSDLAVSVQHYGSERDRALAELERSEKEAGTLCAKVVNLSADLAAERDSLSRMQGAYESLERERSGLSARLIDLQGKYESQVGMGADMEITRLRADLAAERERRKKAEAWMDHLRDDAPRHVDALDKWLKTCENMAPLINRAQDAEKERDEARAEVAARESQLQGVANARREDQERIVRLVGEVAALKARKVKLPPAFEISVYRDGKFIKAMEADRVIDAIRAAGVDVES